VAEEASGGSMRRYGIHWRSARHVAGARPNRARCLPARRTARKRNNTILSWSAAAAIVPALAAVAKIWKTMNK